ncbi:MAG TPA: diguanylate cyclase, partial [Thiomicrospira sp.]|nr:diguanylate cyclase [Thiomicrospira sp.]
MSTTSQEFDLLTWQTVLDSLPNPVALSRRQRDENNRDYTEVVFVNLAFKSTLGYTVEDIPSNTVWLIKAYPDPEYRAYMDQEWSNTIQKAKQSNSHVIGFSSKIRCQNGEDKWFQTTSHIAFPIFDEFDIVTFVEIEPSEHTIQQLHSANQALLTHQTKLEISETKLKETQRIAQVGSWDIDVKTQKVTWSEEMYRIFGRELSYTPETSDFYTDLASDQDRLTIQNAIDRTLATGNKERAVVSLMRHNGQKIYLEIYGQALFNPSGEPTNIVGSTMDITHSIHAQNSLKNQYQLLEDIIDSVPARVFWIDVDGVYQGGNNLFLQDAQIETKDELIGKTDFDLPWGEGYASTYRSDDVEVMNSGDTKHLSEYEEFDQNGNRVIWQSCRVALKDANGAVTGLLCVYEDITERRLNEEVLHEQKNTLHHQAHHDDLTSLPNRVLFQQKLNDAVREGEIHNSSFALLFIDLDQFKQINDSLGHDVGDLVLQEIAKRLQTHIRQEDCLARLGGDEFTILLNSIHSSRDVSTFSQRVLESVKQSIHIEGHTFCLSCSIGISLYPDDSTFSEELLKFSDTAMYRAKSQGRNNAQFYTNDITMAAFEHVAMQSSLNQAIKNQEFTVFYQPKVNAKTNQVIGVEALVRWQHPTLGIV